MVNPLNSRKFILKTVCSILCCLMLIQSTRAQIKEQSIIPQPFKVQKTSEVFSFTPSASITIGANISSGNLAFFNQYFHSIAGYNLATGKSVAASSIQLNIDSTKVI